MLDLENFFLLLLLKMAPESIRSLCGPRAVGEGSRGSVWVWGSPLEFTESCCEVAVLTPGVLPSSKLVHSCSCLVFFFFLHFYFPCCIFYSDTFDPCKIISVIDKLESMIMDTHEATTQLKKWNIISTVAVP